MKKVLTAGLAVAGMTMAMAMAMPGSAFAVSDQFCYGSIVKEEATQEQDTPVSYTFACRESSKHMLVQFTTQIASFDATVDVFGPDGALRPDDRWADCTGELPGFGFGCTGTYTGALGRMTKGVIETFEDPCARDPQTHHLLLRASVVLDGPKGDLSGPYDLGSVRGCPAYEVLPTLDLSAATPCTKVRKGSARRRRCLAEARRSRS
jgi:hypothetical protein